MDTLSVLLIDDEPLALERLRRLLAAYSDVLIICGEATNGVAGIASIESLRPSIVFLDIQMPQLTGFEMLAQLSYRPYVVFTTAYDQYAVRAFEENSLDYLLKPIDAVRLTKTISKIRHTHQPPPLTVQALRTLLTQSAPARHIHAITVKQGDAYQLVSLDEIAFFTVAGKYVVLHSIAGIQHLVDHTLAELETLLPDQFVRISRACIVNRLLIRQLQKRLNGSYLLTLGDAKHSKLETSTNSRALIARLHLL